MRLRFVSLTAFYVTLLARAGGEAAATIVIHNGLAPPNPANVITDYQPGESVYVQNVGCDITVQVPCASPGAPTTVALLDGGMFFLAATESSRIEMSGGIVDGGYLVAYDASVITMSGGQVQGSIEARGSSTFTMTGGGVVNDLGAYDTAHITLRGGGRGGWNAISASGDSNVTIVGNGFAVDGIPVGFGVIPFQTGNLTGTLANGDGLNINAFFHNGYSRPGLAFTGLITLVPEPGTALLVVAGLVELVAKARR